MNRAVQHSLFVALSISLLACSGGTNDDGIDGEPSGADGGAIVTTADGGPTGPVARTGLNGYCDYYKECGGNYYATAQDCIDASIGYWGECRKLALDAFGDCMMNLECGTWNPDSYNPASTECSEEWSDVRQASCD